MRERSMQSVGPSAIAEHMTKAESAERRLRQQKLLWQQSQMEGWEDHRC